MNGDLIDRDTAHGAASRRSHFGLHYSQSARSSVAKKNDKTDIQIVGFLISGPVKRGKGKNAKGNSCRILLLKLM
jgi:hypothetical protein